jgi:hypothetical protein
MGQGDQIWRILAHWVTDYFVCFCENYSNIKNNWATFIRCKSHVLISQKGIGLHIWRLFHKRIWPPCCERPTINFADDLDWAIQS